VLFPAAGVAAVAGLLLLWVATPGSVRRRRERRRATPEDLEGAGSAAWVAGKTAAAVLVAVAAFGLAAWPLLTTAPSRAPGRSFTDGAARTGTPAEHGARDSRAVDLGWFVVPVVVAFALLAPVAVAVRRRRRPKAPPEPVEEIVLARAVRTSIARLEEERDHRRAIVLAYRCMEDAFREVEIVRARDETAGEFLSRAIRRLPVGADDAAALTARFEEARFSAHAIAAEHRDEALEALRRVARTLEADR
jgi:hypothetical protein